MKIYISGPITGHTDYKQEFEKAAEELQKSFPNAQIINPVYLADIFDDVHEAYMQVCRKIWEVTQPDTIYFLRGWEYSRGCQRERGWADADNCTCICQSLEVTEIAPTEETPAVASAEEVLKKVSLNRARRKAPIKKTCICCGKEYEVTGRSAGRSAYCSDECRKKAAVQANKRCRQKQKQKELTESDRKKRIEKNREILLNLESERKGGYYD